MAILKEWKVTQAKEMFQLGINTLKTKNQLVFQGYDNSYINPQRVTNIINQVTKKYNIKRISTHGFRHTHCSLLLEAGVKIKDVQKRLGHSYIKTTMNIYAHVSPNKETEAINIFAQYVGI